MNTIKLSIIIPCYNAQRHIEARATEFADAILKRAMPNMPAADLEIVFVDDGSTDDTSRAIDSAMAIIEECGGIRTQHTHLGQNVGTLRAELMGLADARGRWVYFHDADDPFNPGMLSDLLHQRLTSSMEFHIAAPTRLIENGRLTDTTWHSQAGMADDALRMQLMARRGLISRRGIFWRDAIAYTHQELITALDRNNVGSINAVHDSATMAVMIGKKMFRAITECQEPYWYTRDNPRSVTHDEPQRHRGIEVLMDLTRWALDACSTREGQPEPSIDSYLSHWRDK